MWDTSKHHDCIDLKIWSGLELEPKLNLLQIFLPRENDFPLKAADESTALSEALRFLINKIQPLALSTPRT